MTIAPETDEVAEVEPAGTSRALVRALLAVMAIALLVVAGTVGWLIGRNGSGSSHSPSVTSVDAGFARDMSTHHTQAVTMAGYERDNTSNPDLKLLAYDIETSQDAQVGEMQGWLDTWGLTRTSSQAQMAWMAGHDHLTSDGLMPGMATPAQMDQLEATHGTQLDVLFLQLMIHHHQGGAPMARYAAQHASKDYVRTLAGHMLANQTTETVEMSRLLTSLGGTPLPPPAG